MFSRVLLLIFLTPYAFAQDVQLNFTATVSFVSCSINAESQYQIISLGEWKKEYFTAVGTKTPSVPFDIVLACPGNARVRVYFSGQADPNNHELLALDDIGEEDRGLGVRLMNSSGSDYYINNYVPFRSVTSSNDTLTFYAGYESTRPMNEIKPGPTTATMMFTMDYE